MTRRPPRVWFSVVGTLYRRWAMYRQGDVLMIPVKKAPKGAKPVDRRNGRLVLAEGEATGHAHTVADGGAALLEHEDGLFLEAPGDVVVEHQEHATVDLPAGTYKVIRQREYTPQEIRNVRD